MKIHLSDHLPGPAIRARLTDPRYQRCFEAAVDNLLRINTVPCDHTVYNTTGLLGGDRMFRAGGEYDTPWTRDAAVNTWNAGRYFAPEVARDTLFAVCAPDEGGLPVIQPDSQRWDRVVWILGAWQYWLSSGDTEFLETARDIAARSMAQLQREWHDESTGLFRGGSFFNDGIAGYPADLYEPGVDSSFVGDHPKCSGIFCLSTNLLYCEALRILWRMGAAEEREWLTLRDRIRTRFARPDGGWSYLLYPDGRADGSVELSGHALGVLFGILPEGALDRLTATPFGVPSILPPFPGLFSEERPGRHNNLIWPFLNGFLVQAAAKHGRVELVARELEAMTKLFSDGFREIYSPCDGRPHGGWQIGGDGCQGHLWHSCRDQTWSATGYLGAVLGGVFGLEPGEHAVGFRPCVPENLADLRLSGLTLRGWTLDIHIHGHGTVIEHMYLDGKPVSNPIPYGRPGTSQALELMLRR